MPPDVLAALERKPVWGTYDFVDAGKLVKRFYVIPGLGRASTRADAEWSWVHQLATDSAGFQHRRAGLAVQLGPEDVERFGAALAAEKIEVFPL
jgi:hypothetical protein